jgi:tRNA G10  N-methylase Trm11
MRPLISNVSTAPSILFEMSQNSQHSSYTFISGKNWKLSLAELTSYLEEKKSEFKITDFSRSFFIVKTKTPLDTSIIDELGGILKIGKIAAFFSTELLVDSFLKEKKSLKTQITQSLPLAFLANQIPAALSGKAIFGISVYWATETAFNSIAIRIQRFFGSQLKGELHSQGKKTRFMGFPKERTLPQLTPVEVIKKGLIENNAEILLCIGKEKASVGTTVAVHNPFEFQKRDVEKPVQRKIFGISPRIAKILVNLSHCTEGKVFLDPFCGVGNVLQEALLARAKVIGIDINGWCVQASQKNLEWLSQEYSLKNSEYTVLQGDSRHLSSAIREEIDCIATEPDLGPALRQIPTTFYAEKIVDDLHPLFYDFLREAAVILKPNGFLAIVTPYIKTLLGKPVRVDIQEIAKKFGLQTVKPCQESFFDEKKPVPPLSEASSFIDVDERHKIGREISIFQKKK